MTTQTQKQSAHHLVVSLNVSGGFLAGAQLQFADGLNCLIAGRGAGKTTALEFLRFGLGRRKASQSLAKKTPPSCDEGCTQLAGPTSLAVLRREN
jgi:hypothetical protein